jgi:hypothetical protein
MAITRECVHSTHALCAAGKLDADDLENLRAIINVFGKRSATAQVRTNGCADADGRGMHARTQQAGPMGWSEALISHSFFVFLAGTFGPNHRCMYLSYLESGVDHPALNNVL